MVLASIRAVIFDLDGVISDTQILHSRAEASVLRRLGVEVNPSDLAREFSGVRDDVMFEALVSRHGLEHVPVTELLRLKDEALRPLLSAPIIAIPGAIALIQRIAAIPLTLGVASGSPLLFIERVLQELHIRQYFKTLVSADEVPAGKPAPDVFLEAARRLSVEPELCVVIEDGINGMHGAVAAGMRCIGYVPDPQGCYPTTELVSHLEQITDEILLRNAITAA